MSPRRRPFTGEPSPEEKGGPWQALFWVSWPLALLLGVWAGYMLRPPTPQEWREDADALDARLEQLKHSARAVHEELNKTREQRNTYSGELEDVQKKYEKAQKQLEQMEARLKRLKELAAEEQEKASGEKGEGEEASEETASSEESSPAPDQPDE